jgi:hypothetical protein
MRTFTQYLANGIFPSHELSLKATHSQSGLALLWQVYIQNIDPTMKVLHAPSMQSVIEDVLSGLENISKETDCLLASIKFAAVTGLNDEHCWKLLNAPRASLLDRFRAEVQAALIAANFLGTHDLNTLQAYIIYQVHIAIDPSRPI